MLETPSDVGRIEASRALLRRLADGAVPIALPIPALVRFHEVMTSRLRLAGDEAIARLAEWRLMGEAISTDDAVLDFALDCAAQEGLGIEQAVLMACAASARCDLLLTARMPDGLAWRGVTAADPFAPHTDPRLQPYLT